MPKLVVKIGMELEGVTNVRPADNSFEFFFNVMCTSCREEHPNVISFNQVEEHELSGSRGSGNFVYKCTNCKRENSLSFIPPTKQAKSSTQPLPYSGTNGSVAPFIGLDCRGMEVTKFDFRGTWKADGEESGEHFDIELEEGDDRWDDYDETAGGPVSISEFQSEIARL